MESKPAEQIGMDKETRKQFAINVNMALMLAHVADGFLARAEQNLRDAGRWRLDIKKQMNKAILELQKVTTFTDASLLHSEAYFYSDVHFWDALATLAIKHVHDNVQQAQLLDYIQNGLNEPKEYPHLVITLREMLKMVQAANENQAELIEKLDAKCDQQNKYIDELENKKEQLNDLVDKLTMLANANQN